MEVESRVLYIYVNLNIYEKYIRTFVRNHLKAIAILAKKKEQKKFGFLKLLAVVKNNLPSPCLEHYSRKNLLCVSQMVLEVVFSFSVDVKKVSLISEGTFIPVGVGFCSGHWIRHFRHNGREL